MRRSALLRAAAPHARPHKTRHSHKPLDGSNRVGCMSPARAATRRSNRDILGATKLVKIAARVPELCGDGPWFRPSSLAADPSGSGRSVATLGVSSASAPCQALLRIPLGPATRWEREKRLLASVGLVLRVAFRVKRSGLRPGYFHQCCYAQRHRPHGQTGQDAVAILLDGGNRAGCFRSGRYRVRTSPGRSRNGATPKAAGTPYVREGRHRSGPQLVESTLHRRGYGTMHSCSVCVRMLSIGNSMYRRQEARYPRNEFPDAAWEH